MTKPRNESGMGVIANAVFPGQSVEQSGSGRAPRPVKQHGHMDSALEKAFRGTQYRVLTRTGELQLRIDQRDPALAELVREAGVCGVALMTAFNPGGRRWPPFRNRRLQRQLHYELSRLGHAVLQARNESLRGRWPVEPSLLVLGLPLKDAGQIAARYGQVAFLWSGPDGTPRLHATAAV